MIPLRGDLKVCFRVSVPLNNIDKFLDLLRKNKENMAVRNFGENCRCADADLPEKGLPLTWVRMGSYFLPFGLTRAVAWA